MKKFRILSIILCFVLLLSMLAACQHIVNTDSNEISLEEFTVRMIATSAGQTDDLERKFNTKFPNAKFEYVYNASTTINNVVKAEFDNGNGPDIAVVTDYDYFVTNGYFLDITGEKFVNSFHRNANANNERNGKLYALPIGNGSLYGLVYNKTLFDTYSIAYPSKTETVFELVERINQTIEDNSLTNVYAISMSLMYADDTARLISYLLSEYTQTNDFTKFIADYSLGMADFNNQSFQDFLSAVDEVADPNNKFTKFDDQRYTAKEQMVEVIVGNAFLTIGDVTLLPQQRESNINRVGNYEYIAMGVPVGDANGSCYVSYSNDTYLGINSNFKNYSEGKKAAIRFILDEVICGENSKVVAGNSYYTSNYFKDSTIKMVTDVSNKYYEYYKEINSLLKNNMLTDHVNITSYYEILGEIILKWINGTLLSAEDGEKTNMQKATEVLETFRTTGTFVFEHSEEALAILSEQLTFNRDYERTQETIIADTFADMARNYMGSDVALINAGIIKASLPEKVTVKNLESALYNNYLVNIKMSGETLKKLVKQAINTVAKSHSGKFPSVTSGLKITYGTTDELFADYLNIYNAWLEENPGATEVDKTAKIRQMCNDEDARLVEVNGAVLKNYQTWREENSTADMDTCIAKAKELAKNDNIHIMISSNGTETIVYDWVDSFVSIQLLDVTLEDGTPINDEQIYTVTVSDYMLKKDGYTTIFLLNPVSDTDRSCKIYDRFGNEITGADANEIQSNIVKSCKNFAGCVEEYLTEIKNKTGEIPYITVKTDGRLIWKNQIFFTN